MHSPAVTGRRTVRKRYRKGNVHRAYIVICPSAKAALADTQVWAHDRGSEIGNGFERPTIRELTHPQGRFDRREAGLPRSMRHGETLPLAATPSLMHCWMLLLSLGRERESVRALSSLRRYTPPSINCTPALSRTPVCVRVPSCPPLLRKPRGVASPAWQL